jgi:preprotein translocase subunit SecG
MDISTILNYGLAIVSILLVIVILLQNRNGGLGTVFGGSAGGEFYRSKRGVEAFLYNATIILGVLFVVIALAIAVVNV